jgi:NAD(P)-dependent dehydrogenase (short-subunit alcohol dehydrogenase family)
MKDLFDLSGRTAIITGGSGLLGLQHSRALLQRNCGIMIWDINSQEMENASAKLLNEFPGRNIQFQKIDVTSEQEIAKAILFLESKSVLVDILINNAAINPKFNNESKDSSSHFESYSIATWNKEIEVGLTGAMLCSKHIGSHMVRNGGGVILNISSDLSVIAPDQRIYEKSGISKEFQFKKPVSYSVIKAGLVGLTKFLATYWAGENIRVNSLSPGGVFENQDPDFVENLTSLIPMSRMAKIDEYIGAVQYLCSDASDYMTGQNIVIDGGRSVW